MAVGSPSSDTVAGKAKAIQMVQCDGVGVPSLVAPVPEASTPPVMARIPSVVVLGSLIAVPEGCEVGEGCEFTEPVVVGSRIPRFPE